MIKARFIPVACVTALGFALSGCAGSSPTASPGNPLGTPATTAAGCPTSLAKWLADTGNKDIGAVSHALSTAADDIDIQGGSVLNKDSSTVANVVAQALAHAPMPSDVGAAHTNYTEGLQTAQAGDTAATSGDAKTASKDYFDARKQLDAAWKALYAAQCSVDFVL